MQYVMLRLAIVKIQTSIREAKIHACFSRKIDMVVNLQRVVRGIMERRRLMRRREAVRRVQCSWRGALARANYKRCRSAAVLIQLVVRLRKRHLAARCIQTLWRKLATQADFNVYRSSATSIQSLARCKIARVRYLKFLWGIVLLQGVVRGQRDRSECRKYHDAATCIQSSRRRSRSHAHYSLVLSSTITVQAYSRGYVCKIQFMKVIKGTTALQSVVRGVFSRQMISNLHDTATRIASSCRCHNSRVGYKYLLSSVILVQSLSRGRAVRKDYAEIIHMCISLQSVVRGTLMRRKLSLQQESARRIQSMCRRSNRLANFKLHISRVITIQSWVRMKSMYLSYEQFLKDIVCLQRMIRGLLARKNIYRKHEAVKRMQSKWRSSRDQTNFRLAYSSVVLIQSFVRGRSSYSHYLKTLRNAIILQALFRGAKTRNYMKRSRAASLVVQRNWRIHLGRFISLKHIRHLIKLQSLARMIAARNYLKKHQRSARIIQVSYLTWKTEIRQLKVVTAVTLLQRIFRGFTTRNDTSDILRNLQGPVQPRIRQSFQSALLEEGNHSSISNALAQSVIVAQNRAAVRIQSSIRSFLVRKTLKISYIAASAIQRFWRSKTLVVSKCRHGAAVRIQSLARLSLARLLMKKENSASILIQDRYRYWKRQGLKQTQEVGALVIQSCVRSHFARKKLLISCQALLKIQRFWRSHKRKEIASTAATIIQSFIRSYLARQVINDKKQAGFYIMQWYQYWMAENRKRQSSATLIQNTLRMTVNVRKMKRVIYSAKAIQRFWRCHAQRISFQTKLWCAVKLQSRFRCFLCTSFYQKVRTGFVCLQAVSRGALMRQKWSEWHNASMKIQITWRCLVRERRTNSARLIQSRVRGFLCQDAYAKEKKRIIFIQAYVRRYLAIMRLVRLHNAAAIIQHKWKCVDDIFATERCEQAKRDKAAKQIIVANMIAKEEEKIMASVKVLAEAQVRHILDQQESTNPLNVAPCVHQVSRRLSAAEEKAMAIAEERLKVQSYLSRMNHYCNGTNFFEKTYIQTTKDRPVGPSSVKFLESKAMIESRTSMDEPKDSLLASEDFKCQCLNEGSPKIELANNKLETISKAIYHEQADFETQSDRQLPGEPTSSSIKSVHWTSPNILSLRSNELTPVSLKSAPAMIDSSKGSNKLSGIVNTGYGLKETSTESPVVNKIKYKARVLPTPEKSKAPATPGTKLLAREAFRLIKEARAVKCVATKKHPHGRIEQYPAATHGNTSITRKKLTVQKVSREESTDLTEKNRNIAPSTPKKHERKKSWDWTDAW